MFPRMVDQNPVIRRTIRYKSTGGLSTVTGYCLLSLIGAGSTVAASKCALINAIKIRKITMWALDVTATQEITLLWQTSSGPAKMLEAYGNSFKPAKIVSKPPPLSLASFWLNADVVGNPTLANIFFQSNGLADYILDLDVDLSMEGIGSSTASLFTGTATAVGVYYYHLDCLSNAGGGGTQLLVPVAFTVDPAVSRP